MQALVMIAKIAHRLFDRVFMRQSVQRGELQLHSGCLVRQLQQHRIVRLRREDLIAPNLQVLGGNTRCSLYRGLERCAARCGIRHSVFLKDIFEHGANAVLSRFT